MVAKVRKEGGTDPQGYLGPCHAHPMFLKRILHYLNPATLFGKSDPNSSLRFMHGVNRISFFLFLFCVIVMVVRACR